MLARLGASEADVARLRIPRTSRAARSASPRAYSKKRSRRSQKAASSASVLLYGLPPTIASLEWKSRFSTGSPARREIAREADHVVERRIRRPQPAHARDAELPEHALRRVVARRARVEILQPPRQPAVQRGRDRHFEHAAGARLRRAVVGEVVGRERRLDEVRAVLVRLVEERRDARFDPVAEPLERRHVRRGEAEPAGAIRDRPLADRALDRRRSATRADPRTAAAAGWTRTGGAGRPRRCTAASPTHGGARRSRSRRPPSARAAPPRTADRSRPDG